MYLKSVINRLDRRFKNTSEKNEWTHATVENINLSAHARALGAQITGRVHLTKLVHDCLPSNHWINRYNNGRRCCPGCNHKDKTQDHILRCNYQGYQNWQMSFITCMQEFHAKNGTLPILIHLWNKALEQWFGSEEEIQVATIFFSQELCHLILQHNHMDGDKYSMDVFLLSGQESKKIVILFARL